MNMRLQGHAAVKVPMAFVGKLLAGKLGAAEVKWLKLLKLLVIQSGYIMGVRRRCRYR